MRDGGTYPGQHPERQPEHPEPIVGQPGISGSQPDAAGSYPGQPGGPAGQPSYPANQASYPGGPVTHPGGPAGYPGGQAGQPGGQASYPGGPSGQPGAQADYPGAPASYPGGPAAYPGGAANQSSNPAAYTGGPAGYPGAAASYPGAPASYPGGPAAYPGGAANQSSNPAAYPSGAPGYPGGPASAFGTPAGQPPQMPPPSAGGGHGGRHGGGSRAKWSWSSWWIGPYLVGAVAVLLVFAILQVTVLSGSNGSAAAAPKPRVAAQAFPDALFTRLTKDIQTSNEKDFLSLTAASAQPAVQLWWGNMQALGFSTGLIMPTNKYDQVNLNSNGDGSTIALAGTHNELDPVHNNQADVPLEQYQIGLHFSGLKAIGQITSWKGLGNAPWDQGKLYVRKGANVIVAGLASEHALVDETLPLAQTAAAYDVDLVNHVHNTDIRQTGFVVFVSHDSATRSKWFSTIKQPPGWPPFATSLTAQLPGPSASDDQNWKLGGVAADTTGGARVVITPWEDENKASESTETAELVTRFAQDILSSDNQSLSFLGTSTAPTIPAWAIEGYGVAFEAAYESNTNATPDKYSFSALTEALKTVPASEKTGTLPTADQLYNSTDQVQQNARIVAASVYAAIATKYGMAQLLGSAGLMWTQSADPRGNVLDAANSTNDKLEFFDQPTIQSLWQAYLASPTDLAPATGPTGI